jgi:hypothetical protein
MRAMRWLPLIALSWSCSSETPELDAVTGAHAVGTIEGQLSLAYSHDMQGETKPCG